MFRNNGITKDGISNLFYYIVVPRDPFYRITERQKPITSIDKSFTGNPEYLNP